MVRRVGLDKKGIAKGSEGTIGLDIISQFATPFVRTPGNIIERSIEYSPLGFIKNGLETARDYSRGLDFNQQRFVDEFGRSVLGTAGLGGAIALYNNGVTNGSYSKSKPVKQAQQDNGMIEYGVNLPIGENGANVDLSFMPVVGTLLTEGAAIGENKKANPDASGLDNLVAGSSALINTLIDASAMQGLQRLVGGSNSYSSEGLAQNLKNTFESGLGQLEPSWLRQVASVSDDYQRSIANGDRDYAMNNLISGIPALRENKLEPKVSGEGELILQNQGRGLGSKIFENMILPGKYSEYKQSDIRDEQMRLSETTTETKQFGGNPSRSDITSDTFTPTDKSFREYSQIYKQTTTEIENALLNTSYYKNLDDADKVEILSKVDSASKSYAREKILGSLSSKNTLAEEYKKGGVRSVIDYLATKSDYDSYNIGMKNKAGNRMYEQYNTDGLKVMADIKSYSDDGKKVNTQSEFAYFLANNISPETAGEYLYYLNDIENTDSKAPKEAYEKDGYEGLYDYYLDYYIKNYINNPTSNTTAQKKNFNR